MFPQAFQCVGLGLGNAIGAAIARPDRLTVAALGDGGALLALPEFETLGRLGLPILVVIYDDAAYGAEVHHFRPLGQAVDLAQFPETNFAALAEAAGCRGLEARGVEDLEGVREWLADARPPARARREGRPGHLRGLARGGLPRPLRGERMPLLTDLVAGLASGDVRVVDLTQPLSERTPVLMLPEPFANTPGLSRRELSRYDDRGPAWAWDTLEIGEHVGTHFDAPIHWITGRDGEDVASVPPARLVGPAVVIDRSAEAADDPDYLLRVDDIRAFEAEHGAIPEGAWLLLRTGWDARADDQEAFLNGAHTPGPDAECARFLAEESPIAGFGVETVGTDAGAAHSFDPPFPVHHFLLGAGKLRDHPARQPRSAAAHRRGDRGRAAEARERHRAARRACSRWSRVDDEPEPLRDKLGRWALAVARSPFALVGVVLLVLFPSIVAIGLVQWAFSRDSVPLETAVVTVLMATTFAGLWWAFAYGGIADTLPFGRFEPTLRACILASFAVVSFTSLTSLLVDEGVVEISHEARPEQDILDQSLDFYLWHLLNTVPLLDIPGNLNWTKPFEFDDSLGGLLVILFTGFVIFPLVQAARLILAGSQARYDVTVPRALEKHLGEERIDIRTQPGYERAVVDDLVLVDVMAQVWNHDAAIRRLERIFATPEEQRPKAYLLVVDAIADRARDRIEAELMRAPFPARLVVWREDQPARDLIAAFEALRKRLPQQPVD